MYIVMLIEQHVCKYAFTKHESNVLDAGSRLLKEHAGILPDEVTMTGREPGTNKYGEANMIMYADVFEIRAAEAQTGMTYYSLD